MMTLMPVSCWKKGMSTANASCGLYLPPKKSSRHGCATALLSSLAVVRSSNSARTSSTPRILASVARAASPSPRAMSDTGVSGMASDPSAITAAGTVPNASPTRHPHPPAIFDVQYVVRLADRIDRTAATWEIGRSIDRSRELRGGGNQWRKRRERGVLKRGEASANGATAMVGAWRARAP
ncbi:Os02g0160300 [Oryza sativa Japonica Group]|uniref:Os02g0160300 protein n=2 Tax=Oryza sativa subsp. japonica TaxID=39947 RepID=A0A0P0VF53_ORYSJ|nr:hypothetical protein OsJ_05468 [Oryza sativa Japonica Group]KAB8085970.1 hypothetical protein EE612_009006 [Oryza sativa]BAF07883.1 Os02g0160300 [Oryza sativa Japonica Group]BAS77103.1 Os02g0160300 [Oryza sativa Japonica Group]|eukprot:NP_001045969.1 Os02g0160300 [Oryza sativa Japonica Group]